MQFFVCQFKAKIINFVYWAEFEKQIEHLNQTREEVEFALSFIILNNLLKVVTH